jgi:hypothetical protein
MRLALNKHKLYAHVVDMSQDLTDHKGRNVEVGLLQVVVQRPSIVGLGVDSAVV